MKTKKKWTLRFEDVPTKDLRVDLSYQRPVDKRYRTIAANFDELLFRPLQVSERTDGHFYVIDGSHRLAAAKHLGYPAVPCEVYTGLTINDERHMFANQDKGRVAVSTIIKFKAECRIPNSAAAKLLTLFEENELLYEDHGGTRCFMRALAYLKKMMESNQEENVANLCYVYGNVPTAIKTQVNFWHCQMTRGILSALMVGETPENIVAAFQQKSATELYNDARTSVSGHDLVAPISRLIQREIAGLNHNPRRAATEVAPQ